MNAPTRREFLKRSAAVGFAAAGFVISGTKASGRVLGANDRIRVAVAGVNSRGREHLAAYCNQKDKVEVAYLADPDSRLFPMGGKFVLDHAGDSPKCVQDLRRALEDKDLDAVSIATPDHWHTMLALWALQAGKDVYVEKPCSHFVSEGRRLVEAAQKSGRIVQHGTQSRSNPSFRKQLDAIRSGKYGKLLIAYGYASKKRRSIGFKHSQQPPKELNFDLWLGPARQQPYHENLVHYNWHWFWDFGAGEIGNQGVHQLDIARWAMPENAEPKSVIGLGGRFGYKDQGETPNTQLTIIDFGEAKLIFEDRGLVNAKTTKVGNEFLTTEGIIKDGRFFPRGKNAGEPIPGVVEADVHQLATLTGKLEKSSLDPQQLHFDNFIDCVRSRKREDLNAPIIEGHRSSMLCHLGNISYRLGVEAPFMDSPSSIDADPAAREAWGSMKQHLIDVAAMDMGQSLCRVGRPLRFDAKTERFVGDPEADKLLEGVYRKPFVMS